MNIDLNHITKAFGQVLANDDINLSIPAGTIQGILGENGAGKSTLMKVLSGYIQADKGEILLDGKQVKISTPEDAIRNGIGMLHQDPLDFPPMRLIENFVTGSKGGVFPNWASIARAFNELQSQFEFSLDPNGFVDTLTIGERQQLEILRLLWLGAKILILDEPTTGISSLQKTKLFSALTILASQGKTIIFVSHKLEDVEQLCDCVAVLQRGKLVGKTSLPYHTDQLVQMMFGKSISLGEREECQTQSLILDLQNLFVEDNRIKINNIDLQVYGGEVIGIAGMEGSGQQLLLRVCAGLVRSVSGKIYIRGKDLTDKNYHTFMEHGVSYVPASRMEEGLIPGMSIIEHIILSEKPKGMIIDQSLAIIDTKDRIQEFNIRGQPSTLVEDLSGGNQQRTLLALLRTPLSLILMEHPTRGLDMESTIYIWSKLKERCRQDTAILFISSDLEEILHYSNRILVFFAGRVSQPLDAKTTTVDTLGQLIGGKRLQLPK